MNNNEINEKQKIALLYINKVGFVKDGDVNKHTLNALYKKGLVECWYTSKGNEWELTKEGRGKN